MSAHQHYEKILLTKQDLAHVYRQFVDSAQTKIKHYLPVSDSNDPLQIEVENLVNEHLAEVFEMAKSALIVDGHDLGQEDVSIKDLLSLKPTEEVVPFDTDLNQKLRLIIQNVEKETTEVTRLRRELPQRARDAYESLVANTDQEVTTLIKELNDYETPQKLPSLLDTIPKSEELADEFLQSVLKLHALKNFLPKHRAQLDSLNQTIQFLEDSYRKQESEGKFR